ncbi:peptidylprolyl isomerase [Paenibacillus sp. HB172176]|uniref:peptidylprolyl isomerase n=1 Tax=Paenibacillus sp. HB172176 TaxID=2493690 RepID=UPI00143C1F8F|nr:peptidylprolyl isomerase [Paenibacillus sp. HB172176]
MNRSNVLKSVVILQAVCMIVLTGIVVMKVWPLLQPRGNTQTNELNTTHDNGQDGNAADQGSENEDKETVASVGGKPIARSDLDAELYRQYGDAVLREMMLRMAMDMEGEAKELDVPQEELDEAFAAEAEGYDSVAHYLTVMKEQLGLSESQVKEGLRYRLLMDKIRMEDIQVTDDEVEQYIIENAQLFEPKVSYHLQWIVTTTEVQAQSVLEKLEMGEPFGELAGQYSQDEFTKDSGGDLGVIDAKDPFYDQGMLQTASAMTIGETAGPIAIDEGYAVILLADKEEEAQETGAALTEKVRKKLALELAKPQKTAEDELLAKYHAVVSK